MSLSQTLQEILPDGFRSVVETSSQSVKPGYNAIIYLDCKTADDCDKWLLAFSKSSFSTWRIRRTYPKFLRGLKYRRDYVCQHSDFNKSCHEKYKKTKDTACPAKLNIKVNIQLLILTITNISNDSAVI